MFNFFQYSKDKISFARPAVALSALVLACLFFPLSTSAEGATTQQVFPRPDAAVSALVAAGKTDDMKALSSILGPDADQVLSSGDPVADKNARDDFALQYQEMHRLEYDDLGRVILYVGANNWPVPVPLVKKNGGWIFDTAAGKDELLYRRIGRNELFTIKVLEDLADAQTEYASEARDAESTSQFGYYYKVLTRQGGNAPGGAKDYLVDGKMTNGFAFLAYPADYRASGVMTFMINQDGVIVQKDFGPDTAKLAIEIAEYNPDKSWQEVDE